MRMETVMCAKVQTHNNDKAGSKQLLPKPATESLDRPGRQQAHPATIIQRAQLDTRSLTQLDVLHLQQTIGNHSSFLSYYLIKS